MRCVSLLLLLLCLSGCGALYYKDGERKLSIVKVGFDTTMESGEYSESGPERATTIKISGYKDEAKIELLRQAIDLAK